MSPIQVRRSRIALIVAPLLGALSFCGQAIATDGTNYDPYPYAMPIGQPCPPIIECCPPATAPISNAPIELDVAPLDSPSDQNRQPEPSVEPEQSVLQDSVQTPEPATIDDAAIEAAAPNFDLSQGLATNFGSGGANSLGVSDLPNVMGDFLGSGRNTSFNYNLAGDANPAKASGGSTAGNSKISDNNSAIPRDRVSFRYHYFDDAASQNAVRPSGQFLSLSNGFATFVQDVVTPFEQDFDTHLFEFAVERRITENVSFEIRLPFVSSLDSNLELDSLNFSEPFDGTPTFDNDLFGIATPAGTLGRYDLEIRDLTLITKAVLLSQTNYVFSGGLGVRVPISEDSTLRVADGINTNPAVSAPIQQPDSTVVNTPLITMFRQRDVQTDFQTVSLTPFLALAAQLTDKSFLNAFASVNVPVGKDEVTYRESFLDTSAAPAGFINSPGAFFSPTSGPGAGNSYAVSQNELQRQRIREQTLLSFDVSVGRWIYEARNWSQRLQRIALVSELHYTTTLNDADLAVFNGRDANGNSVAQFNDDFSGSSPESPLVVGNVENRLDVLNATFGIYSQWGRNVTFASGIGVPLRDDGDKLFDYELQFQLNWYPAGFSGLPTIF